MRGQFHPQQGTEQTFVWSRERRAATDLIVVAAACVPYLGSVEAGLPVRFERVDFAVIGVTRREERDHRLDVMNVGAAGFVVVDAIVSNGVSLTRSAIAICVPPVQVHE